VLKAQLSKPVQLVQEHLFQLDHRSHCALSSDGNSDVAFLFAHKEKNDFGVGPEELRLFHS
jgi:hypothetical protein